MNVNAEQAGAVTAPDRRGDSKGLADDQERTGSENLSRLPNDPQPSQSRHEIHRPQHGAGPRPRGTRSIQRPRLLLGGPPAPPFGSRSPDRAWDASASPQCDSLYGGPRSSAQDLLSQSPALAQRPTRVRASGIARIPLRLADLQPVLEEIQLPSVRSIGAIRF